MSNIVIVVENGLIQDVYSDDKNIFVDVIDFDSLDDECLNDMKEVLKEIKNNSSYKIIY